MSSITIPAARMDVPLPSSHLVLALALNTDLTFCEEGVRGESLLYPPHLGQGMGRNRCSIKICGRMARTYQEGPKARNAGSSAEGSHTFPFHLVAKPKPVTVSFTYKNRSEATGAC